MNGKSRFVDAKTAQYMDGSGRGKIAGDMRPLEPLFPIKSYKQK
jgi:hypothetical protein